MAAAQQRALYRTFLRGIYSISHSVPVRVNLIRLFRGQLRGLLSQPELDMTKASDASELSTFWPGTKSLKTRL